MFPISMLEGALRKKFKNFFIFHKQTHGRAEKYSVLETCSGEHYTCLQKKSVNHSTILVNASDICEFQFFGPVVVIMFHVKKKY